MPKPVVSLRVRISLPLYERIGEYRHTARHETRQQALVALIAAGLAALAKPVDLPPQAPAPRPNGNGLVPFAGSETRRRSKIEADEQMARS